MSEMNTDSLPVDLSPENLTSLHAPGLAPKEPGIHFRKPHLECRDQCAHTAGTPQAATADDRESKLRPCYKLHPLVLHILYAHGKLTLHHRKDGSGYFDEAEVRALEELAGI